MVIDLSNVNIQLNNGSEVIKLEDIYERLNTLFSTIAGTVPMYRAFGINGDIIDKPLLQAKALLTVEYIEKTRKYIPEVEVKEVRFEMDGNNGLLKPKVVISIV